MPHNLVPASTEPGRVSIPIDPKNWEVITDAMAEVPGPLGTANSAHLQGIDFAGKTGSAQTISNTLKAKLANGKQDYKDNAWFVGVTPRRNPELVVGVLFEGGEHGQFAARLAAQVVKAYVDKQRRQPVKVRRNPRRMLKWVRFGAQPAQTAILTISRQLTLPWTYQKAAAQGGRSPRAYTLIRS